MDRCVAVYYWCGGNFSNPCMDNTCAQLLTPIPLHLRPLENH